MTEYIECEAAFNAILKLIPKVDDDGYCWVIRGDAAKAIDSIPAADVRPVVHGEWHEYDDDYGKICCSVCEEDAPCDYPWNYCPNCGADMREES